LFSWKHFSPKTRQFQEKIMEIQMPHLHHGSSRLVTLDEMEAIPAPVGTDTWRPVPHRRVVDAIHSVALAKGLSIAVPPAKL
jgi:hypothetical protein